MEMHQIRYFLVLSEELSFTIAAKRCGISQPSLTNAIKALERHLGGRLFQRWPEVTLTALGCAIWPHMKQIAQSADDACEAAGVPVSVTQVSRRPRKPLDHSSSSASSSERARA
jgi:DNA-binding transcriptional LysR family regulator